MIRIVTRFGDKRVKTLFFNGSWVTLVSDVQPNLVIRDADTLYEAGLNHLEAACTLREKLSPTEKINNG